MLLRLGADTKAGESQFLGELLSSLCGTLTAHVYLLQSFRQHTSLDLTDLTVTELQSPRLSKI